MRRLHMRTRKLGGQYPVDVEVQPMPFSDEGDKPEVILTLKGSIDEQRAVVGLRPGEALRLARLLNKAYDAI